MNKKVKQVLSYCLLFSLGLAIGYSFSPGPFKYWYKSSKEIYVFHKDKAVGTIPAGMHLLTDTALTNSADHGFWGYFPVYFGTASEAGLLIVPTTEQVTSVFQMLRGMPFEELPKSRTSNESSKNKN
jgi:hypothetical protein